MNGKLFLFGIFLGLTLLVSAQERAIAIKHIGEQDKSIYPFIISNYTLEADFSDKYLKYVESMSSGPTLFIDTIICRRLIFNEIDSNLRLIIDTNEIKRTRKYGSLVISWIENDSIIKQVETTNKNEALKLFYAFSDSIKGLSMFEGKYKLLRIIDDKICRMYMEEAGCDPPPNNR